MKTRQEKLTLIKEVLNKHLKEVAKELEQEDINFLYGTLELENTLKEKVLATTMLAIDKETVIIDQLHIENLEEPFPLRDRLLYTKPDANTQVSDIYFTK